MLSRHKSICKNWPAQQQALKKILAAFFQGTAFWEGATCSSPLLKKNKAEEGCPQNSFRKPQCWLQLANQHWRVPILRVAHLLRWFKKRAMEQQGGPQSGALHLSHLQELQ